MLDAVIISDMHLGSTNCQARSLCKFMERFHDQELRTERLILNGDMFDSFDFRRLKRHHWRVLSLIRKLSDQIEIIWICGNHDGSADIISHLLGVTVKDEFVLESGDRRILILHGHTFDSWIDDHPFLTWIADCAYALLQWIDPSHHIAKWAKHGSKTFVRCSQKTMDGSRERARKKKCDAVCCGHTHHALCDESQPIAYYNSGCWTERPSTYLTVQNGEVELHKVEVPEEALQEEAVGAAVTA